MQLNQAETENIKNETERDFRNLLVMVGCQLTLLNAFVIWGELSNYYLYNNIYEVVVSLCTRDIYNMSWFVWER